MQKHASTMALVLVGSLFSMSFVSGCAHDMDAAPPERATGYAYIHKPLPEASRKVDEARAAGKDKQCPAEFNAAKDTVDKAYAIYKSCRTQEGIATAQEGINMLNALCPVVAAPVAPPPPPPPAPAPEPAPAPAPEPAPKQSKVMVFDEVALFDVNKAVLKPEGKERIKAYREQAKAELSSTDKIKITGYTDSTGPSDFNKKLSLRRAEAVRAYLVSIGVDPSKLEIVGEGEDKPVADNGTKEGRAKNRRVEIEVSGLEK